MAKYKMRRIFIILIVNERIETSNYKQRITQIIKIDDSLVYRAFMLVGN